MAKTKCFQLLCYEHNSKYHYVVLCKPNSIYISDRFLISCVSEWNYKLTDVSDTDTLKVLPNICQKI